LYSYNKIVLVNSEYIAINENMFGNNILILLHLKSTKFSIRKYTSGETISIIIGFGYHNSFQQKRILNRLYIYDCKDYMQEIKPVYV
jgi:hypothetical protein